MRYTLKPGRGSPYTVYRSYDLRVKKQYVLSIVLLLMLLFLLHISTYVSAVGSAPLAPGCGGDLHVGMWPRPFSFEFRSSKIRPASRSVALTSLG